jgi:hypothetical protein
MRHILFPSGAIAPLPTTPSHVDATFVRYAPATTGFLHSPSLLALSEASALQKDFCRKPDELGND